MICEKGRYYEIVRNGKMEVAICVNAGLSTSTFEFLDADQEKLIITQDLIDGGFYKLTYAESVNTLMS